MFSYRRILLCVLLFAAAVVIARPQGKPDFSGHWKQENDRCQPKRNGDVTLQIEHHGPELTVETSIARKDATLRHATQKYTTDGKPSVSTGADGDEFHTSIAWNESTLVFSIEEHEDGRILQSKEMWSVIEDGRTLERIREQPSGERQTLIYRRISVSDPESKSGLDKAGEK